MVTKILIKRVIPENANPNLNWDFFISAGNVGKKEMKFSWTKANGYQTEVPTRVEYYDETGTLRVLYANYAKHLLTAYPKDLAFVKEIDEPEFVQPAYEPSELEKVRAALAEAERERKELEQKIEQLPEAAAPKRRGRPPKVQEGESQ